MNKFQIIKQELKQEIQQELGVSPNLNSIRIYMLNMIDDVYQNIKLNAPVTANDVEKHHYMREWDAEAVAIYSKKHNVFVSFRNTGKHTIERIKMGHPCKGHDILDKSIKNHFTHAISYEIFSCFKGLIGKVLNGQLHIWCVSDNQKECKPISDFNKYNIIHCYTGDYDCYDLIIGNKKVKADSFEEYFHIDGLNTTMLNYAVEKSARLSLNNKLRIANTERRAKVPQMNTHESPYALIRHGVQNLYFTKFLMTREANDQMNHVSDAIDQTICIIMDHLFANHVIFGNTGEIHLIDNVEQLYAYYRDYEILESIPYYCFFFDLQNRFQNIIRIEKNNKTDVDTILIKLKSLDLFYKYLCSLIYF